MLGGDIGEGSAGNGSGRGGAAATNFSSIDARNMYLSEVFETVCQVFGLLTYENGITRVYMDCEFLERNLIEADLFMWPTMLRHRTFENKLHSAREGFWAERSYMAPETVGENASHSPPPGGYFSAAQIPSWLDAVAAIDRLPVGAHIKDEFYRILGRLLTGAGTADRGGNAESKDNWNMRRNSFERLLQMTQKFGSGLYALTERSLGILTQVHDIHEGKGNLVVPFLLDLDSDSDATKKHATSDAVTGSQGFDENSSIASPAPIDDVEPDQDPIAYGTDVYTGSGSLIVVRSRGSAADALPGVLTCPIDLKAAFAKPNAP